MIHDPVRRERSIIFPSAILDLLDAARLAEHTATGTNRRRAYRDTRAILGALRESGYSTHDLAELMDLPDSTVRQRVEPHGVLTDTTVIALTSMTADELAGLPEPERVSGPLRNTGDRYVAALDVVRALLRAPNQT